MIQSYLKTALRNLWKHKGFTFINILGLAIGMACVILIMLYVRGEFGFDRHHPNAQQIYRLNIQVTNPQTGEKNQRAIGPYRLAKEMRVDFPDMEAVVRIAPQGGELVEYNDIQYSEEYLAFVDPEFIEVFEFPLIKGTRETVLDDPYSLIITEAVGRKYFGSEDPIGKTVSIRDQDYAVTGIMEEVPESSLFQYDMLVSMNSADQVFGRIVLENWGEGYVETFAFLPKGTRPNAYATRLQQFVDKNLESWSNFSPELVMQPLGDMYLRSADISSFYEVGDITYVYAFSFIALFILIIACINFMNLATARSSLRAKEVGLRKVVGAQKGQLIGQFLSESTILALISLIIAVALAALAMPAFNQLADKNMTVLSMAGLPIILGLVGIAAFVGLAAGSYPALILSGYKPVNVLSGKLRQGMKGGRMRKVLVTFQFATSIFLLVVTGIVYNQIQYCKNIDLGFDKDHVIVMGTPLDLRQQYDQFRTELLSNPQIVNAAGSSRVPPGRLTSSLTARPEGVPEDEQRGMQTVWTDFDFIETMGFELTAGRSFSRDFPSDAEGAFILNEAAVKEIGWTNETAINKTFGSSEIRDWNSGQWQNRDGKVIGVVENFHFESLKQEIKPTVYFIAPYMAWNYVVRIRPERLTETIAFIEEKYTQFTPDVPFQYTFIDENYAQLYLTEERQGKIFGVFAILAIFIGCLGLVGLASFTAERKKKEVGIRKVLGASSANLVMLLSKEFTTLVIIAFIIAAPISWYVMQGWLQDFAYRAAIGIQIFLAAGLMALLIAWITVAYQTARTALTNPVEALQQE